MFVLPFLVIQILDHHWKPAFALLWIAGVSDAFDGLRIHTDEIMEVIARISPSTLTIAIVSLPSSLWPCLHSLTHFAADGLDGLVRPL